MTVQPCTSFVAVHESAVGTEQARACAAICPLLVEADIGPLNGHSGYDPQETCAAWIAAAQSDQ